ncbi:MBL fold metallo-hydrolase [Actinoplanes regularis]|uniref:Glyoxylase, beta-lactamase superfamily II n=1 Tax=Actinoplanes regularis TaxID=52697 RepID=A0A239EIP2_9ACTN|nr:MBL fold metallo-hydrolase [Actinoplanes regularis]GIE89113.1 MBL fold metallo-hydrolase [Actinoplanes regularis]SNS44429.1 Glyoxylase, beta-lactamase superfamily II [Actinoplanes regularis]
MREVVDGVFELRLGFVNVHLVVTDDGVVLLDTGVPGQAAAIERALRPLGELHAILLTHHHPDHAGNAAALRERTGARLITHAAEAPFINGAFPAEEPTGWLRKFVFRRIGRVEPTKIDQLIGDGAEPIAGFTAVHTPGHTRGHLSFLLDRAGGVLFAGDAAVSDRGKVAASRVLDDPARAAESLSRLAEREFEHAVFGHGPAISGQAAARFREAAA